MKNLSIILTALSAGSAPMLPPQPSQEAKPIVQPVLQAEPSGKGAITSIRTTYEKGGYAAFLKELDDSYIDVKEKGQLKQLAEMRTGSSPEWQEWESRAAALHNEKNSELLDAVENHKNTPFVEKVLSAAATLSDEANQNAIQISNLRFMAPGAGKNSEENLLIDIDLEYEYKSLHIDLPGSSTQDKREKICALKMEKLDKLLAAASSFKDPELKKMFAAYAKNFDARLAQSWDIADLNALTNGKRKPADALEEKVASILLMYQEKFSDMSQQFIAEHEKN